MDRRYRIAGAVSLAVCIFLLVQVGALALVKPFVSKGFQQTPNPQDPTNSIVYLAFILVATAAMLLAFRFGLDRFVRGFLILVSGMIVWYVFVVFLPPLVAVVPAAVVALALYFYPEWYVIDTAGVLMGAGAAGLFGISFGILPAIILLAVLAVYDAISVYGTEHMLTLAEGVMDLRMPVVLAIPTTLSYSFLADETSITRDGGAESGGTESDGTKSGGLEAEGEKSDGSGSEVAETAADEVDAESSSGETAADEAEPAPMDREAIFIGLGDTVMPTILVASSAYFLSGSSSLVDPLNVPFVLLNLPALCAMIGTLVGLLILLWMVLKGRAHAGLPLLNGGAILGYLIGALASGLTLAQALGL